MGDILIGFSTCWRTRRAFEKQGHRVWTCDLRPAEQDPEWHFQCNVWDVLYAYGWDMAVLHPMCTYLTAAAAWAFEEPDFKRYPDGGYHQRVKPGTVTGKARCRARDKALREFRQLLDLPYPVAIENPGKSFITKAIRPPDQIVQPYWFGNDASKLTAFWLTGGLPQLKPTRYVEPRWIGNSPRWGNQTDSGQNKVSESDARWLERSGTYPGIADAMGKQWGRFIKQKEGKA